MKQQLRSGLILALTLALLLSLAACGESGRPQQQEDPEKEEVIQIGMTFDSFVIERWLRDQDIFVSTAQSQGAEVYVQNANGDMEEQIAQVEYFIEKEMDAIVIVAVDCYAMGSVIQKAKEAGIAIVAYDRLIMDADLDLFISFNNETVGRMMGQAMAEKLPDGSNIICITGPYSDTNVNAVMDGFQQATQESGFHVVYQRSAEGWLAEVAYEGVTEAIDQRLTFSGIMCGNDDLATQAFQALSEHRMAGSVCLVGQDADLAACQRIVEGTQTMTVYKPVEKLARAAAEYTIQLAKGEPLGLKETTDNGREQVPTQLIEPIQVTRENMEEVIIDGGFHLRDEVYLNLN